MAVRRVQWEYPLIARGASNFRVLQVHILCPVLTRPQPLAPPPHDRLAEEQDVSNRFLGRLILIPWRYKGA